MWAATVRPPAAGARVRRQLEPCPGGYPFCYEARVACPARIFTAHPRGRPPLWSCAPPRGVRRSTLAAIFSPPEHMPRNDLLEECTTNLTQMGIV